MIERDLTTRADGNTTSNQTTYTISMGPYNGTFLTDTYTVRDATITATTPDGKNYTAKTNETGIANFIYMPWLEFPNGTEFRAEHPGYETREWQQGEEMPTTQTHRAMDAAFIVILVVFAIIMVLEVLVAFGAFLVAFFFYMCLICFVLVILIIVIVGTFLIVLVVYKALKEPPDHVPGRPPGWNTTEYIGKEPKKGRKGNKRTEWTPDMLDPKDVHTFGTSTDFRKWFRITVLAALAIFGVFFIPFCAGLFMVGLIVAQYYVYGTLTIWGFMLACFFLYICIGFLTGLLALGIMKVTAATYKVQLDPSGVFVQNWLLSRKFPMDQIVSWKIEHKPRGLFLRSLTIKQPYFNAGTRPERLIWLKIKDPQYFHRTYLVRNGWVTMDVDKPKEFTKLLKKYKKRLK